MFYFIFDLSSQTGDTVIIKVNGKIYAEVSLSENKEIEIYSDGKTLLNTVRIQDNKAFVIYANCPDKRCTHHKPLESKSNGYGMIVCLPNRVTVEIKTYKSKNKFDAVIG